MEDQRKLYAFVTGVTVDDPLFPSRDPLFESVLVEQDGTILLELTAHTKELCQTELKAHVDTIAGAALYWIHNPYEHPVFRKVLPEHLPPDESAYGVDPPAVSDGIGHIKDSADICNALQALKAEQHLCTSCHHKDLCKFGGDVLPEGALITISGCGFFLAPEGYYEEKG